MSLPQQRHYVTTAHVAYGNWLRPVLDDGRRQARVAMDKVCDTQLSCVANVNCVKTVTCDRPRCRKMTYLIIQLTL